jgi:hypothetical protein
MFGSPSRADLIEDERIRFEQSMAARLGVTYSKIRALRDGEGYAERLYLTHAWYWWAAAVGLIQTAPDRPGNEHAVVDSHGQPLDSPPRK